MNTVLVQPTERTTADRAHEARKQADRLLREVTALAERRKVDFELKKKPKADHKKSPAS
jgi:sugar phosphate isomerase/epimerase